MAPSLAQIARTPIAAIEMANILLTTQDAHIGASPKDVVCRLLASPVPTYTMSGLFWSMAMSPMDAEPYSSKMGSNVVPALVDL